MKISSAELHATIAIVTSAGVFQIRQHMEPLQALPQARPKACEQARFSRAARRAQRRHSGFMRAGARATRRREHALPLPQRGAARVWV